MTRRFILLINQDPDTVRICTDLFSSRGLDTRAVEGMEEGLRVAREEGPAVIVTELLARTEDGWEVIRLLRAAPETARIPLIALTAHALAEDRLHACGADVFVPKPALLGEVLAAVERFTDPAAGPVREGGRG